MSKYINEKIIEKLNFIVGNKATILAKTIVRVFTANPDEHWKDSGLMGFLCLVFDRSTKAPYIRVFETDTFELVFEMELYYNFTENYKKLNNFFYFFEVKGGFIGLSIQDEGDAELFRQKISNISPKHDGKESKAQAKQPEKKQKKKGFFKNIYDKITGKSDSDEEVVISRPEDVKHEASVKFDFKKGTFDIKNIPPEWKTLFKKAGIEKKHLIDSEYAPLIMETILNNYTNQEKEEENENPAEVNPVPVNTGGGPIAPVLNLGGGPPAPVLNLGGGPQAPVLNLGGPSGGGPSGMPSPPVLDFNKPSAPVLDLNKPPAPTLDLNKPQAPALDLNKPPAPTLDLNKPSAPMLDLNKPSAPALSLNKPATKPAGNDSHAKSEKLPAPSADRGDLLAQIRSGNFALNKVKTDEKKATVAVDIKKMPKKAEESLTNTLAAAIAERRKQLMKNNYKEKETSDWSDN